MFTGFFLIQMSKIIHECTTFVIENIATCQREEVKN